MNLGWEFIKEKKKVRKQVLFFFERVRVFLFYKFPAKDMPCLGVYCCTEVKTKSERIKFKTQCNGMRGKKEKIRKKGTMEERISYLPFFPFFTLFRHFLTLLFSSFFLSLLGFHLFKPRK